MDFVKKIPGGWTTILVGGAVALYLIGNANVNPSVTTLSNDTVGVGVNKLPGGLLGTLTVLAAAGAFLNKQTVGTVAVGGLP